MPSSPRICALDCPPPIEIPIRNITLPNNQSRRGAALGVGQPIQNLAFQLYSGMNNTFMYDNNSVCASENTADQCQGLRGGFFDPQKSSSWAPAVDQGATGASPEVAQEVSTDIWGQDDLAFNSTFQLRKHPLALKREDNSVMNSLGLGRNCSLLNSLKLAGAITSRTWGLFNGWTGIDAANQMDGSLVLGGYDEAKVSGPKVTENFTLNQGCESSFVVTVTDVSLNLPNGTVVKILRGGSGSAMRACIMPEFPIITLPPDVWKVACPAVGGTFLNRSRGLNIWGMVYSASDVYKGSLTVSIAGLEVTIPNEQLVVPEYVLNSRGQTVIASEYSRELLINPLQEVNKNDMPILGQVFLASSYLHVDEDSQTFSLWRSVANDEKRIVATGDPRDCPAAKSAEEGAPSPSPVPAESAPGPSPSKALSTGAVAGAITSGIVAASLAVVLAWFLCARRWRRQPQLPRKPLPPLPPDDAALMWRKRLSAEPPVELGDETEGRERYELS
ncbi:MAG: hypothetical protein M1832_000266 [Thelocarpon impressellum]|nr:MAG: hypothetical protein M1832_000266 [Thelocarpon impressellum]